MKKVSLLLNCPNMSDATSLYRAIGPVSELSKSWQELELRLVSKVDWSTLSFVDAVFMQRPYSEDHAKITKIVNNNRKPLWVDYDDDLLSVPPSNPTHRVYSSKETMMNVCTIVARSDVVTVSTKRLKEKLDPIRLKTGKPLCVVVPNSLPSSVVAQRLPIETRRKKLIMWRGSSTHDRDLMEHLRVMQRLIKRDPTWTWMFVGGMHWSVSDALRAPNAIFAPAMDPKEYFSFIAETQPAIVVVPLHDSEFNRAKSNIAWLEAAFCGAVAVVPDWEEWQVPGAYRYCSPKGLRSAMERAMSMTDEELVRMSSDGWLHATRTLSMESSNMIRRSCIESVLRKD